MIKSKKAKIKFEREFGEDKLQGYSCYLYDVETGEFDGFSWFYPVSNGTISEDAMLEMYKLNVCGYKIYFV